MEEDLIPGLPDEIARECLIRVPYNHFPKIRSVRKLWKQEVDSPSFHRLRKSSGLTRTIIALAQADPTPSPSNHKYSSSAPTYRLSLYYPFTATWHSLPPIPGLLHGLTLFCQIAAVGRELVVIGGWDPQTWAATDGVHVYDFVSATWRFGARMPGPPRSFFACAASDADRIVIVAGGHDEGKNALRSALAYDVARDEWVPLPDMARERDECRGVFLSGKFYVIGGYCTEMQGRFSKCAEVFDVATRTWDPVEEGLLESGTCPRTCVAGQDGNLYMCEGGQVSVRDGNTWRALVALPGDVRVALQIVAWEGSLMVMGSGSHGGAQVCYILEEEGKELTWRKADVPLKYSGHIQAGCCLEI